MSEQWPASDSPDDDEDDATSVDAVTTFIFGGGIAVVILLVVGRACAGLPAHLAALATLVSVLLVWAASRLAVDRAVARLRDVGPPPPPAPVLRAHPPGEGE